MRFWGFDFEVFKRFWCVTFIDPKLGTKVVIYNNPEQLRKFYNATQDDLLVGFSSSRYDNYIYQSILAGFDPWRMNEWIVKRDKPGWQFSSELWKYPIRSFDCMTGFNGLKTLEGFMGLDIRETQIPFDYDGRFTPEMVKQTLAYNEHDVMCTLAVFIERKAEFDTYMGLRELFGISFDDFSRTKVQLGAKILGARKTVHKDEFNILKPENLRLERYRGPLEYFYGGAWNYGTKYECTIAGVPHVYGTGGIHGAIPKYAGEGDLWHVDVTSYYPSLMLRWPEYCWSRTGADLEKFREMVANRVRWKAEGNPLANAVKPLINGMYGAMKDPFNPLYDPRQANHICIFGQLYLTDLIERIEDSGCAQLVQSNTDGLIVSAQNSDRLQAVCHEWEERVGVRLEFDELQKVVQRDVNNYIAVFKNGKIERKGAAVKENNILDNDLPIINKSVTNFLLTGASIRDTIYSEQSLIEFQKLVKLSSKYKWVEHEGPNGNARYEWKCYRVFATDNWDYGHILKCDGARNPAKFANTPDHCVIENSDIRGMTVDAAPFNLDREWYVNEAMKRVKDFGLEPR